MFKARVNTERDNSVARDLSVFRLRYAVFADTFTPGFELRFDQRDEYPAGFQYFYDIRYYKRLRNERHVDHGDIARFVNMCVCQLASVQSFDADDARIV